MGDALHPGIRFPRFQRRRLHRSGASQAGNRNHFQGPLSERYPHPGERTPAEAGVLLRVGVDPGHRPPLQENPRRIRRVPRQNRHPVERHPPGPGHPRTHANFDGPGTAVLGKGVGDHREHLRLHQPHHPAGSPGEMERGSHGPGFAAPSAHHLRNQPPVPGGGEGAFSQGSRPASAHVADRRTPHQIGPHGPPGHRGQPRGQRRRGASFRDHQDPPVPRFL